jgi:aryl-alcohol dehydrogenase-like predicted oxidoreductase
VQVALDVGLNFIGTSPCYGRGMSKVLLAVALRDTRRDRYGLITLLGRYDRAHVDFAAKRVQESADIRQILNSNHESLQNHDVSRFLDQVHWGVVYRRGLDALGRMDTLASADRNLF